LLVRLPYMACSTSAMVACMKQMMVEVEQQQQAGIPCTGSCSQAHPDCLTRMIVQLLATTEVAATDAANNRTAGPIRAFWAPAHLSCHTATGAVPPSNNTRDTAGLLGCQKSAVHCYADAAASAKDSCSRHAQLCQPVHLLCSSTHQPTAQQCTRGTYVGVGNTSGCRMHMHIVCIRKSDPPSGGCQYGRCASFSIAVQLDRVPK
jgi:hypothetical protein